METDRRQTALNVSRVSIFVNILLSVGKLAAGITARSQAMVSDGVHSLSDVLSTFVVMIGVSLSDKEADEEHPYGHERMECVAAIILAVMLAITGAGIGLSGLEAIAAIVMDTAAKPHVPGLPALIAAVISIMVKEGMFQYTKRVADRIRSGALLADAWHHRSDALSSIGSFVGIGGALLGYPVFDPLASVVICLFIFKAAYDIFSDAVNRMVDASVEEEIITELRKNILCQEGVLGIDDIRTRMFGSRYYVDVEISADGAQSLKEAHDIAEKVHDRMEELFPDIKHIMVHVNPV